MVVSKWQRKILHLLSARKPRKSRFGQYHLQRYACWQGSIHILLSQRATAGDVAQTQGCVFVFVSENFSLGIGKLIPNVHRHQSPWRFPVVLVDILVVWGGHIIKR